MITFKAGDLMLFSEDAMGHGCNCQKHMGSGVAYAVKHTFPEMTLADTNNPLSNEDRLGTYGKVKLSNGKIGYNIYSQFKYGRDRVHVDYAALERALQAVCVDLKSSGLKTLALPMIGCGLAGGSWIVVEGILNRVSNSIGIDIVVYINNGLTIEEIRANDAKR